MEEEETTDWTSARIIFGRLIEIDKVRKCVTVEYKDEDDKWITESFSTDDWDDEDYQEIRGALGEDINLTVEDNTALDWDPVG
jgi:hypothetical protein